MNNTAVIAVSCGLFLLAFGLVFLFRRQAVAGAHVSQSVENLAGMAAFALAFTSIAFSIHFPLSLTDGVFVSVMLVTAFLAFVVVQYTSAFWLTAFWKAGNVGLIFTALLLMVCTILISIAAGQSFLQDVTANKEKELLAGSDAYKAALSARAAAERKASDSAVSKEAYKAALGKIQTAQAALRSVSADNAAWVADWDLCIPKQDHRGRPYTTRADQACAAAKEQQAVIAANQGTVSAWDDYQANAEHAERLKSKPLPAAIADGQIPGFRSIANLTGIPYELVRDNFWMFVSVFVEIAAQCCFIFWGWNKRRRAEQPEPQVLAPQADPPNQQPAQQLEAQPEPAALPPPVPEPGLYQYQCNACETEHNSNSEQRFCSQCGSEELKALKNPEAEQGLPVNTSKQAPDTADEEPANDAAALTGKDTGKDMRINTRNEGEYQTGSLKPRRCWYCHETYTPKAPHQKYCRDDHRLLWHGIKPDDKGKMLKNKARKYA